MPQDRTIVTFMPIAAGAEVYVFGAIAGRAAAEYARKVKNWDEEKPALAWEVDPAAEPTEAYTQMIDRKSVV